MMSPLSGYITVSRNVSNIDPELLFRVVPVPHENTVMVSFREILVGRETEVTLFRHFRSNSDAADLIREEKVRVWNRQTHLKSDFAHLFEATKFSVQVARDFCIRTECFKLFFSFFAESKRPANLSPGLLNCSVEYYATFHHHVACNLKTECEDGRDETGPCPYSSSYCQGMIAMCHRCYTFVEGPFFSNWTDVNKAGDKYCASLGGSFNFPKCLFQWFSTLRNKTRIHRRRLHYLWLGLYSNDMSLPRMYRHSLTRPDRTVFHHSFPLNLQVRYGPRLCFLNYWSDITLTHEVCAVKRKYVKKFYGICEHRKSIRGEVDIYSSMISLNHTQFVLSTKQQSVTECHDGQVSHTLIVCGSNRYNVCEQEHIPSCKLSQQLSNISDFGLTNSHLSSPPTFLCKDDFTKLSYTLVCDFLTDCPDNSDESFCTFPPCSTSFQCTNGQCLPFDKLCDQMVHCGDESDEKKCKGGYKGFTVRTLTSFPSRALVRFNCKMQFTAVPMNFTELCPDSHYRCLGEFNDCLPVYTRCNGMYDCIDHQDENGCEEIRCPGLFRCRLSTMCVHSDHMCDGWSHCPMNDDELACNITCPVHCLCQGHTFMCFEPFAAVLFPQVRYLDVTGTGMTLTDVSDNTFVIGAVFAHCSLTLLPQLNLLNIRSLDLSYNKLEHMNLTCIFGLEKLQTLSLSNNPLTSLHSGDSSDNQLSALTKVDLSEVMLTVLDSKVFLLFPLLQKLNLTRTTIHTISRDGFRFIPRLTHLYMDGSPLKIFPHDVFEFLFHLRFISTQNYKLCCSEILPHNFDDSGCIAPKDEISSCEDLLESWTYRGFLWLIAFLSVTGNVFCCCARVFSKSMTSSSGFSVFVVNLTIADFLMGVYISIIGGADEWFRGKYLHNDDMWKSSITCKCAGFMSLLSSEVSALIIWLITLYRFVVLRFPFSTLRFDRTSAAVACLMAWLIGWSLASLPLLPVASHWEFYSQTGICIPLPVTRRNFKGRAYSFGVLIVLNFITFLFISAGQAFIYWSVQDNALKTNSTKVSKDITIARRLITVAVTDFLCWFPIGLCGMLALGGVPIPGEVNVALAVFVLPLNSAINPFMYTFNILVEKRRKANEARLMEWLESHTELTAD